MHIDAEKVEFFSFQEYTLERSFVGIQRCLDEWCTNTKGGTEKK